MSDTGASPDDTSTEPMIGGGVGPVGVVGGGQMGSGIAHALLLAGATVSLVESTDDLAAAALSRVGDLVRTTEERGKLTATSSSVLARLTIHTRMSALAGVALVVEAVPEIVEIKAQLLADLEEVLGEIAVIASNTSSISIDELAVALRRPERFLGMHFFNPVPASSLVEIVRGARTSPASVKTARQWVAAMSKTPIVVGDSPGFASSRLGVALGLEAIRMVQDGVASAEDIDAAMTLGYKHPVGPLRLTDMVGLDVRLGIATYLESRLGSRFTPPRLLRDMVDRGEVGRKSGKGFYVW